MPLRRVVVRMASAGLMVLGTLGLLGLLKKYGWF